MVSPIQPKRKTRVRRELRLKVVESSKRALVHSRKFKAFIKNNRGVLSQSFKIIRTHYDKLLLGKEASEGNIKIQKASTGEYKGRQHLMILKVTAAKKEFFLKISLAGRASKIIEGIKTVEYFLKKKGHKIGGFNVRVVMPHLIYEAPDKSTLQRVYFVTDFYNKDDVVQLEDMKKSQLRDNIFKVFLGIKNKLESFVQDMHLNNAFYQQSTNTILLFDLYA